MRPSIYERASEKKKKLIDEYLKTPLKVGDSINIYRHIFNNHIKADDTSIDVVEILSIDGDIITAKSGNYKHISPFKISTSDILSRQKLIEIGPNPFSKKGGEIRSVNYGFDSIIFELNLTGKRIHEEYILDGITCNEVNWNPYVYNKDGSKEYYQRPLVWTLEDKQSLIDSIYNHVNLGLVLVRKRAYEELKRMRAKGETELAFKDIVDGKQRLHTIKEFLNDEFPDSYGNYYSDLSCVAQNSLIHHQLLQYCELPEYSKDEDIIHQFLKLNFTGVPQSEEHIEKVKSLSTKIGD